MLPTDYWPVGKIVQDKLNIRLPLKHEPSGQVAFFVGLRTLNVNRMFEKDRALRDGELIAPTKHDGLELFQGHLVPLACVPYAKDTPHPRDAYKRWRQERKVELSPHQPWGAPPLHGDR